MKPARSVLSLLLYILTLLLLVLAASSPAESRRTNRHVAIFVFGDSIYDPGNNDYLNVSIDYKANYPPYGETFFRYPTGRFCDGRTIPDFTAMYANLPIWEPYLQPGYHDFTNGANFASAGAGVLPESNRLVLYLRHQLSYFKNVSELLKQQLGDAEAKKILMNAIYLNSFGGVDYYHFISENLDATESEQQEYVKIVIGNLTEVIKEIYEMDGRKFAFQNVGPLACIPSMKQTFNFCGQACLEPLQALASLHNSVLSNITRELQNQLSGFEYLIFDYFNALSDITNQPEKYGFSVSDIGCCGTGIYRGSGCGKAEKYELCPDPSEYVYFDGGHPTEHAYSILADMLWNGESNYTWPVTMKQLSELNSTIEIFSEDSGLFAGE